MFNINLVSPHLFSDQGVQYHLVSLRGTNVIKWGLFCSEDKYQDGGTFLTEGRDTLKVETPYLSTEY